MCFYCACKTSSHYVFLVDITMVLGLCLDVTYCDVVLLCSVVMVWSSPRVALFLQMCYGVFFFVIYHCASLLSFHVAWNSNTSCHRCFCVFLCTSKNVHVMLFYYALSWSWVFILFWFIAIIAMSFCCASLCDCHANFHDPMSTHQISVEY